MNMMCVFCWTPLNYHPNRTHSSFPFFLFLKFQNGIGTPAPLTRFSSCDWHKVYFLAFRFMRLEIIWRDLDHTLLSNLGKSLHDCWHLTLKETSFSCFGITFGQIKLSSLGGGGKVSFTELERDCDLSNEIFGIWTREFFEINELTTIESEDELLMLTILAFNGIFGICTWGVIAGDELMTVEFENELLTILSSTFVAGEKRLRNSYKNTPHDRMKCFEIVYQFNAGPNK